MKESTKNEREKKCWRKVLSPKSNQSFIELLKLYFVDFKFIWLFNVSTICLIKGENYDDESKEVCNETRIWCYNFCDNIICKNECIHNVWNECYVRFLGIFHSK